MDLENFEDTPYLDYEYIINDENVENKSYQHTMNVTERIDNAINYVFSNLICVDKTYKDKIRKILLDYNIKDEDGYECIFLNTEYCNKINLYMTFVSYQEDGFESIDFGDIDEIDIENAEEFLKFKDGTHPKFKIKIK